MKPLFLGAFLCLEGDHEVSDTVNGHVLAFHRLTISMSLRNRTQFHPGLSVSVHSALHRDITQEEFNGLENFLPLTGGHFTLSLDVQPEAVQVTRQAVQLAHAGAMSPHGDFRTRSAVNVVRQGAVPATIDLVGGAHLHVQGSALLGGAEGEGFGGGQGVFLHAHSIYSCGGFVMRMQLRRIFRQFS